MVGTLLDTLEATGLSGNTLVVVTPDHGDMLGERGLWFKKHFFDHAARGHGAESNHWSVDDTRYAG